SAASWVSCSQAGSPLVTMDMVAKVTLPCNRGLPCRSRTVSLLHLLTAFLRFQRLRTRNAIALRVVDPDLAQPVERLGQLDELGDGLDPGLGAYLVNGFHFCERDCIAVDLADHAAVYLHEFRADHPQRVERDRFAAERAHGEPAPQRFDLFDGARDLGRAHRYLGTRHLEAQHPGWKTDLAQARGDELWKVGAFQGVRREVDVEHGVAHALRRLPPASGVLDNPPIERRHELEILEYRQESPRRRKVALFLPQPDQDFEVETDFFLSIERNDGLPEKHELVVLHRLAQTRLRGVPPRQRVHQRLEIKLLRLSPLPHHASPRGGSPHTV